MYQTVKRKSSLIAVLLLILFAFLISTPRPTYANMFGGMTSPQFGTYLILYLFFNVVLEVIPGIFFLYATRLPKKLLIYIVLGTLISWNITTFLLPGFLQSVYPLFSFIHLIAITEIFAILFEAWFIYFLNKDIITFKKSLSLSIIMNLVSFGVGLAGMPILQQLFIS